MTANDNIENDLLLLTDWIDEDNTDIASYIILAVDSDRARYFVAHDVEKNTSDLIYNLELLLTQLKISIIAQQETEVNVTRKLDS